MQRTQRIVRRAVMTVAYFMPPGWQSTLLLMAFMVAMIMLNAGERKLRMERTQKVYAAVEELEREVERGRATHATLQAQITELKERVEAREREH